MINRKLVLAVSIFIALGTGLSAHAGDSNKSIKGTWSLFVQGSTTMSSPLAPSGTPLVAIATVTFDGEGGCSSIDQIILGGVYIPSRDGFRNTAEGGDCVYQVNEDGTGFFDVTFSGAGPTTVTFVLAGKNEISFIANNESLGIFGGGKMIEMK
ncbi:MAG: hypothetical protein HKM98_00350 [Gammaproteobacteria bacterium]|nr:hypothetical protein [Gammaproteobacteria bacterium]